MRVDILQLMYLLPDLKIHPTFPKFVTFYKKILLHVYSSQNQIVLLDCMPGAISPKVEQAAIELFETGIYFRADTITCVDIDAETIFELNRLMSGTKLKLHSFCSDMIRLPFDDQSFNIITINHPFDDLLYYLVQRDYPELRIIYNLELTGIEVEKQAYVRNEMVHKIITKKDDYFDIAKTMLIADTSRVLSEKGLLVIMNYFTNNWKRYDQFLSHSFSDRIFTLTHDLFDYVRSHLSGLIDITESIQLNAASLFKPDDRIEYIVLKS